MDVTFGRQRAGLPQAKAVPTERHPAGWDGVLFCINFDGAYDPQLAAGEGSWIASEVPLRMASVSEQEALQRAKLVAWMLEHYLPIAQHP